MNEITLIIPAKNEAESLPSVLDELEKFNFKINIVLHNSDLDTIESIKDYEVEIIYQNNLGYGDALIQGIKNCKTKYFCIFNADGSFNPNEISKMYEKLKKNNSDIIFGTRYEKNAGSEDDTFVTLVGNYIFSLIGKVFFKLNISDILYTFVIGDVKKINKLNLKNKDFTFCVELPIKSKKFNYKLDMYPCYERRRLAGKKKVNALRDGFLILISMFGLFFK